MSPMCANSSKLGLSVEGGMGGILETGEVKWDIPDAERIIRPGYCMSPFSDGGRCPSFPEGDCWRDDTDGSVEGGGGGGGIPIDATGTSAI
mmetsp:Transcript_40695/g.96773  ORF Transcript_40695/g.96773 Transcript_40695/m.96773 type:complete len:91 (-) Transcript_40695:2070-2342(-)